jgi:hypothetical protein
MAVKFFEVSELDYQRIHLLMDRLKNDVSFFEQRGLVPQDSAQRFKDRITGFANMITGEIFADSRMRERIPTKKIKI